MLNSSIDSKREYFRRLSSRRSLITFIGHIACKGDNTQFHFNLICCIQTRSRHSLTIRSCYEYAHSCCGMTQKMQIVSRNGTRVILFGDAEKQITGDKHAKIVFAQ